LGKGKGKGKWIYIARSLFVVRHTSRRSGTDHTVLPANFTYLVISKIFDDTKHCAVCLRQLSLFLFLHL